MVGKRLLPATVPLLVLALVLVLVLVVSVIAAAPARLIAYVLPAETVALEGLAGTVWNGRASRAVASIPNGFLHLGALRWELHPMSLLTLSPAADVRSDWGGQRVRAYARLNGQGSYTLRDVQARLAADLLRQFAPLALGGHFDLQVSSLAVRDNLPFSGDGRLVWERAHWQSPRGPIQLGTYAVDFSQEEGEPLRGTILTLAGPLQAEGRVELNGRRYLIDISVSSDEPLDPQLREALSLMATPEGDGYRLKLESAF